MENEIKHTSKFPITVRSSGNIEIEKVELFCDNCKATVKPKKPTEIFIAICEDRHTDTDVRVFTTLEKAIEYCKDSIPDRYEIQDQELSQDMIKGNWLYFATYGVEGDSVRVVKGQLDQ